MEEEFIVNAQQSISAAFDSVNLINETITKPTDDENKDLVKRNVEHLEIMLGKEFFSNTLTTEQRSEIDNTIISGKSYLI
jgi:hypothetical protein